MSIFSKGVKFAKKGVEKAAKKADNFDPFAVRQPERGELGKILAGTLNKGGVPTQKVKTTKTGPVKPLAKPALIEPGHRALVDKIFEHAREQRTPDYPFAENPVFGPPDAAKTKELVPQQSISRQLPPKPTGADRLPANDRSRFILENENAIGERLAQDLRESEGEPLPFYSTGSVIEGLQEGGGLTHPESLTFMRDWAGQGAATSPRTKTPQNLRNASYLMFRNQTGDRLTPEMQRFERDQATHGFPKEHNQKMAKGGEASKANLNRPGYAMMGMHTQLGDEFWRDAVDPWKNPKPFTFRENWMGNMEDVTADTHNIRAVLDAYDRLDPGGIPKEWFTSPEAFDRYRSGGGFSQSEPLDVGALKDGLEGQMINGRYAQTEYPILQGPTKRAASMLDISPAEAQERLWFERGSRTGLQSPRMAIPDLLNAQIEATARATGLSPEAILRLWAQRKIPLAQNEEDREMPGASATA